MKRALSNLLTLTSLALLVFVACAWPWSYRRAPMAIGYLGGGAVQVVGSSSGSMMIFLSNISLGLERTWTWDTIAADVETISKGYDNVVAGARPLVQRFGFDLSLGDDKDTIRTLPIAGDYVLIAVPAWFATVVCSILPIRWMVSASRVWLRRRGGRCVGCGYDLRSSPGRCPECGMVISEAPQGGCAPSAHGAQQRLNKN